MLHIKPHQSAAAIDELGIDFQGAPELGFGGAKAAAGDLELAAARGDNRGVTAFRWGAHVAQHGDGLVDLAPILGDLGAQQQIGKRQAPDPREPSQVGLGLGQSPGGEVTMGTVREVGGVFPAAAVS